MPSCYGSKTTPKAQEQAKSRHKRFLKRRETEQHRSLVQEAAQEARKEKEKVVNEKAKRAKLEAAATLLEFSQQDFVKEHSTQTDSHHQR